MSNDIHLPSHVPSLGPDLSRRSVLLGASVTAFGVMYAASATAAPAVKGGQAALPPMSVRGADISSTEQEEAAGAVYYDAQGRKAPIERALQVSGASWVRLRVWVDPPAGYSNADSALRLAVRARKAGLKVLLDLHYSDFWADPGHQNTPAAWAGLDLAGLAARVRSYTCELLDRFTAAGARPDMVQVGNEVTAGMLWPLGQIYRAEGADWEGFTTLLKAGVAGVRDSRRGRPVLVMVHIDRGGDNAGSRWFLDHVLAAGVTFDVIGQSYYPFWHGSLDDLRTNLADLAATYRKPLVVVETSYPWTLANGDSLENFINDLSDLTDAERFPPTPAGQGAYFEALRAVLAGVPGRLGAGFFAWEPGWLAGVGWQPGAGNPADNLTMFDWSGRALPSLKVLRPPKAQR